MSAVFAHLERVANARTLEDVWAMHTECMAGYGFDRVSYGLTRYRHENSAGDLQDVLFLSNLDNSYKEQFFDSGLYATTPMYRWLVNNTGACSWQWAQDERAAGRLSEQEIKVMDWNWEIGIRAGYTISFADVSARAKGAMGLIATIETPQSKVDKMWEVSGKEILAICNLTHLKITQLPYRVQRRPLTTRQREALEWVADGKTTQDIAILMGVSGAMVEKHLRLAREALAVETTAHAVAKASLMNQIFVVRS